MLHLIVEKKEEIKELCMEIKTFNAMLNVILTKLEFCSNNTKAPVGFKILETWTETKDLDDKLESRGLKNAMVN